VAPDLQRAGRPRFLKGGATLAGFSHPKHRERRALLRDETAKWLMDYEARRVLRRIQTPIPSEERQILASSPAPRRLEKVQRDGFPAPRNQPAQTSSSARTGDPVLIDFGSARQALSSSTIRSPRWVTPGYAHVEQLRRGSSRPYTTSTRWAGARLRDDLGAIRPSDSPHKKDRLDDSLQIASSARSAPAEARAGRCR